MNWTPSPRRSRLAGALALGLALAGAVVAPVAVGASTAAAPPGHTRTAKTKQHKPAPAPLPPLPASASPLLVQAVQLAGRVVEEQQSAVEASERYDEARIVLAGAEQRAAAAAAALSKLSSMLVAARSRLEAAAIEAYVTGSAFSTTGEFLSESPSQAQTADTYAAVGTSHLDADVQSLAALQARAAALLASRRADVATARLALAQIGSARLAATAGSAAAEQLLAGVELKLVRLLGPARAGDLLDLVPGRTSFKGPRLGGTHVGKLATAAQGVAAVDAAKKLLGVPYVWGGASHAGVDCSGLVMLAWAAAGIAIEHGATVQWEESKPVPVTKLRPGDLLFYHFPNDGDDPITHVVMYVGSGPYGPATVIQAAAPGTKVAYSPLYFVGFVGAGQP